jgi:tetratricopeptide (TPR) repeat protein
MSHPQAHFDEHTVVAYEKPVGPPGFELLEEIGHGGMGLVYRARDTALGRSVAVKVLHNRFAHDGSAAERFLSEARITAQLQHPGIPSVHQVGTLPSGYPFLAMKLVKGRTLEEILKARSSPAADHGRLVAVFEAICQAVAYAHAHGIIHRDLKPANVMVGAFGEVQVMDWGLAKVLGSVPAATTVVDGTAPTKAWTEIGTPGSDLDSFTKVGDLVGTPAYAAPEQAAGELAKVDTRADVFGLGAVLCVILTGQPPYVASTTEAVRVNSVRGNLEDCFARLDRCGGDPDLVSLCKRCLAFEPTSRPADAGEVATEVARLRSAAEERARQAELDRVRAEGDRKAAELKTAEERTRRKVQIALVAVVALLLASVGGFAWWQDRQLNQRQAERAVRVQQIRDTAIPLLELASNLRNNGQYPQASAAIDRAAHLLKSGEVDDLLPRIDQARADLDFVRDLDAIFSNSYGARHSDEIRWLIDRSATPQQYRAAFGERGFDLVDGNTTELADKVTASAISPQLIDALDYWALHEPDKALANSILAVLRKADPGSWLDRLRDPAVRSDQGQLLALIQDADAVRTPATRITILFTLAKDHQILSLEKLQESHLHDPTNFRTNYDLGGANYLLGRHARAEGFFRAAVALRPESHVALHSLGIMILRGGDPQRALPVLRKAVALEPSSPHGRNSLAWALRVTGNAEEALVVLRDGLARDPESVELTRHLGFTLCQVKKDYDAGFPLLRKACELEPHQTQNHAELGWCLVEAGQYENAIPSLKRAIELGDHSAFVQSLLARAQGNEPPAAAFQRGTELLAKRDYDSAIAAFKEVLAKEPQNPLAHNDIAVCHIHRGKGWVGASIWKSPDMSQVNQADITQAVEHLQKAIAIADSYAYAHANLGWCLFLKSRLDEAVTELERAHQLDQNTLWIKQQLEIVKQARADHKAETDKP